MIKINFKIKNIIMRIFALLFFLFLIFSYRYSYTGVPSDGKQTGDTAKIPVVKTWKLGGSGNVSFAQGYLKNWVEGGENSLSTLCVLNIFANFTKGSLSWENTAELKYGLLKSGNRQMRKNEDKIELNSKLGLKAYKSLYYSMLINFKTQGFRGYDYPTDSTRLLVSDFIAPAYLIFSVGIDFKPGDILSVMLSPVTSRTIFVRDGGKINDTTLIPGTVDQTKYGLKPGKTSKEELGAYMKSVFKYDIIKNVQLINRLDLFTDYMSHPENIDVNWEVSLTMKINKYLATTVNTRLVYDDNIKIPVPDSDKTTKKIQFKEVLGVGFSYMF
jgi:hypothetical protein